VVASLDGVTGETNWALQLGGVGDDACLGIAVDGNSDVYVVGTYGWGSVLSLGGPSGATVSLGDVTTVNASWLFVAKLSSNGEALWAKPFGTASATAILPVSDAHGDDLMVVGQASGNGVQPGPFALGTGTSTFLARLDGTTGAPRWANVIGPGAGFVVTAMTQAAQERIVLAGSYSAGGNLGQFPLSPPANAKTGAFVAQILAASGVVTAAKGYGDPTSTAASKAVGVLARPGATDADKDNTLLLMMFG